jgi:AcrR family transcriptional regulator
MSKTLRENPIATRSRAALLDAARELLEQRPASEISIKDVVDRAGMSRPTFYQHFTDLGALFASAGLARLEESFAGLSSPDGTRKASEASLTALFGELITRMAEHAHLYARIHESQGGPAFHAAAVSAAAAWLRQQPQLRHLANAEDAAWEFLAAGVVWTVTRYLAASCLDPDTERPERDLARILLTMTPKTSGSQDAPRA